MVDGDDDHIISNWKPADTPTNLRVYGKDPHAGELDAADEDSEQPDNEIPPYDDLIVRGFAAAILCGVLAMALLISAAMWLSR